MQNYLTMPVGTLPTKSTIDEAIKWNELLKYYYDKADNYYGGDHPVLYRTKTIALKNNKLVTNHCKYITDINVGYLLGNPVDYQTAGDLEDTAIAPVLDLYRRQTVEGVDTDIAMDCSIFGRAYEYVFINTKGDTRSAKIDPRNCVVVYDDTIERLPLWAVMYQYGDGQQIEKLQVVTVDEVITYDTKGGSYTEKSRLPHNFGDVPVVEYWNNDRTQGDFTQVTTLVNAYNFLMSDRVNDKEQLVESILAMYGYGLEEGQREQLLLYRTLENLPNDGKTEYLTKQLNEADIEILKNAIEQDIHKISMTPNMSDANFVGNSSGVAIAYKLLPFEQNIKNKQRAMEAGLRKRFELYANHLAYLKKMSEIEISDVEIIFKRNLPKNDLETSQMIANLRGVISAETGISQLSFVKDASAEVEKAREEGLQGMNAEMPEFGTPDATLETLEEKGLVEATAKQDSLLTKLKNLMGGQ
jgi:SPP1 family phage portal protein